MKHEELMSAETFVPGDAAEATPSGLYAGVPEYDPDGVGHAADAEVHEGAWREDDTWNAPGPPGAPGDDDQES